MFQVQLLKSHHQSLVTGLNIPILDGVLRFVVRFVTREHWEDKVVKYPCLGNYEGIMKLFIEWMLLQYTENRG